MASRSLMGAASVVVLGGIVAATINRNTDPLSPSAETAAGMYSPRYDRGGQTGANGWNQAPANGSIAFADFLALLVQFGHTCT